MSGLSELPGHHQGLDLTLANKLKDLLAKNSALGAEFFWVILAQLASLVGGLLTIKLLANLLTQSEFGVYSLLFSIPALLVSMLFTPAGQINMRFFVLARQQSRLQQFRQDQKKMLRLFFTISLVLLIPVVLMLQTKMPNFSLVFAALGTLTIAMGYQTAQQYMLMAFRLRTQASIAQLVGAVARPLGVLMLLVLWGYDALLAIAGLVLGFSILAVTQNLLLKKPWAQALETEAATTSKITAPETELAAGQTTEPGLDHLSPRSYLSYGGFQVIIGIVTAVVLFSDRWILSIAGTLEQVAIYASLMQIALAPTAFGHAVLTRMAAPLYYNTKEQPAEVQNRHFRVLVGFWLLMACGILVISATFHNWIVELITNEKFGEFSYLLPWMVLGLVIERTTQVFEMKGALYLKTHIYMLPRAALILLVPIMEYAFWKLYGFDWLVVGLIVATAMSFCSVILINYRHFEKG